jgi:hypothetical protein
MGKKKTRALENEKDKHEQDEECSNNNPNRFTTKELCLSSNKLKCCKNWESQQK